MPIQKSRKPAQSAAKPLAKADAKPTAKPTIRNSALKTATKVANTKSELRVKTVPKPKSKSPAKVSLVELKKVTARTKATEISVKKTPGRPPKTAASEPKPVPAGGAKRGRKAKNPTSTVAASDLELAAIEAELVGEPVAPGEKVKPLRMKISKAKERALMKEFGLDETILSEEDLVKRRLRLKALIKLGKTRGYLTHGEISDQIGRAHV